MHRRYALMHILDGEPSRDPDPSTRHGCAARSRPWAWLPRLSHVASLLGDGGEDGAFPVVEVVPGVDDVLKLGVVGDRVVGDRVLAHVRILVRRR